MSGRLLLVGVGMGVAMQRDRLVEHLGCITPDQPTDAPLDPELEFVVDRSRVQGVDPNVAACRAFGDAAHQSDLRVLCGHIGASAAAVATQADDARRDDDAAAVVHLR